MDNTTTCPNFPESPTPSADKLTEYLVSNIMKLNRVCDTHKSRVVEWEKEKSMLHSTINEYKKQLENYPNTITQISCDCMVGGDCECEDNCANGMRILKMKEEIESLKGLYQFGTEGKNGEHIELNVKGDMYYNHTTHLHIEKLKEEIDELKEENEELKEERNLNRCAYCNRELATYCGIRHTLIHNEKQLIWCKECIADDCCECGKGYTKKYNPTAVGSFLHYCRMTCSPNPSGSALT